jgi:RNA polymerase sigma-70 factor (ECF subfamily)
MKSFNAKKEFFIRLVQDMRKPLLRYAESRVADKSAAEDIAEDVFCSAWTHIDELMKHENPRGWLYIACKLHIKTYYEKYRADEELPCEMGADTMFDDGISFADKLSTDEMKIVKLKEQGYKHHEIAEIMGLSPGTIAAKVSRIKHKLTEYREE